MFLPKYDLHLFTFLYLFLHLFFFELRHGDAAYDTHCSTTLCHGVNISYPFWVITDGDMYCGYPSFGLSCSEGNNTYPKLTLPEDTYYVTDINYNNNTLTLVDIDVFHVDCPRARHNLTLGNLPLSYNESFDMNISFYFNCTSYGNGAPNRVSCLDFGDNYYYSYVFIAGEDDPGWSGIGNCEEKVVAAVKQREFSGVPNLVDTFDDAMNSGFVLDWETAKDCGACEYAHGRCGYDNGKEHFVCFCDDESIKINGTYCSAPGPGPGSGSSSGSGSGSGNNKSRNAIIGVGVGLGGLILIVAAFFFFYQRRGRRKYAPTSYMTRSLSSAYSSRTDCEKYDCYGLPIFDYEELREATNNFDQNKEVGDGGFGTVYKGTLRDGRVVAIKRLYENNYKRKEQFLNEVEILARLRHPNLVILYGCTSPYSQRLLLVYEFISNGTVADHLHGDRAKPGSLSWFTRFNIAIETSAALLFLHRSDVIHRDVKTYNILLDDNFSVKVADFGLSRLFPFNVTHVSTAPQGTPGYVDPEYHKCYQLTEKSDVYSFGVVLMELISSLPAVDITRHRHEINLSTMAINKIQSGALHELVDKHLGYDCNDNIRKMITAVAELAFRCLQDAKEMRPCMEEVLETLKGIQNLDKPTNRAAEMDSLPDDTVLLKSEMIRSPDSVMVKLDSTLTTPNASG